MIKLILPIIILGLVLLFIIKLILSRNNNEREIFQSDFSNCKFYLPSQSYGLKMDSLVVCNLTEKLISKPFFYFEIPPKDYWKNGFFFVNLDCTDFKNFDNTPNFILCKNKETERIVKTKFPTKKVYYTGFTSIDRYDKKVDKDFSKFIHIAGKSPFKGTEKLILYWSKHPEWPILTILAYENISNYIRTKNIPPNIKIISNFIDENQMNKIYNNYGIHICPSRHEGFGHYINEAKSTSSVVLYTNAAPMNETFIDGVNGLAIDCVTNGTSPQNIFCPAYDITLEGLEKAMKKVLELTTEQLKNIGKTARKTYLEGKADFKNRLEKLIIGDKNVPKNIHYIWISKNDPYKDVEIPSKYEKYIKSWEKHNSDFIFNFWSGEKIFNLILQNFPQYINFYKNAPLICKCDFARFVIVYLFGGVYTDLDLLCKKNISQLLKCENYFIFELDKHIKRERNGLIINGFFCSIERSMLLLGWINEMAKNNEININSVLEKTGPIGLYRYLKNSSEKVCLGNTCHVIPFEWNYNKNNKIEGSFSQQCEKNYNNFTTTLWHDGSDWGNNYNNVNKDHFEYTIFKNPITGEKIYSDMFSNEIKPDILQNYIDFKEKQFLITDPMSAVILAQSISDKEIYFYNDDNILCNRTETLSLINSLNNLVVNYKGGFINFLNGEKIYLQLSFPILNKLVEDIYSKKVIFKMIGDLNLNSVVIYSQQNDFFPILLANAVRSDIQIVSLKNKDLENLNLDNLKTDLNNVYKENINMIVLDSLNDELRSIIEKKKPVLISKKENFSVINHLPNYNFRYDENLIIFSPILFD